MDGIIDKDNNPFVKDSCIIQDYSFTPDRQELSPRLFKRSIEEIKALKEESYYTYPAFFAIRWGFAFLRNNITANLNQGTGQKVNYYIFTAEPNLEAAVQSGTHLRC